MPTMYMSSERGPLGPMGILVPLEFDSKVDSTSHYRESTELQYPMKITTKHQVLGSVTCYSNILILFYCT